ncbi:hypothetical protein TURU_113034 [Turdus rufiventris]|nr:hypothetical protein TURU_113034 [Turdus rufiventris]
MGRDLEVLIDGNLNMNEQCPGSQDGPHVLENIRHSITSQKGEGIVLLCSASHSCKFPFPITICTVTFRASQMHTEDTWSHRFEYSHIADMPSDGDSWQESAADIWAGGFKALQSQRAKGQEI